MTRKKGNSPELIVYASNLAKLPWLNYHERQNPQLKKSARESENA